MDNLKLTNEPVVFSSEIAEELELDMMSDAADETASGSTEATEQTDNSVVIEMPEDMLTNEVYLNGVNNLVNVIDSESVHGEVMYVDSPSLYAAAALELPDYAVVYQCQGVDIIFPTSYAENILIADGLLINLGASYTAGCQIDGYTVDNYLSSEITIPTYHSATWYQYLQSYGQPYRIVDRYVNNYGNISSSTRGYVSVEWSGGNPFEGCTFDKAALFIVIALLA